MAEKGKEVMSLQGTDETRGDSGRKEMWGARSEGRCRRRKSAPRGTGP